MTHESTQLQSDGYHTFAELYEHRHALFLALMRFNPERSWVSLRHHDGEIPFGDPNWFIAGMGLGVLDSRGSEVMITYHLPIELWPHAMATGAHILENGKEWDGHTPQDVVDRLLAWVTI
jgi:hypothetical protein